MSKLVLSFSFIFLLTLLASCSIEPAKIESFMSPKESQEDFLDEQEDKEDKPEILSEDSDSTREIERLDVTKKFNIEYLNIDIADVIYDIKPLKEANDYVKHRFRVYSKTEGFVDYFAEWRGQNLAEFRLYENRVSPEKFKSKTSLRDKTRNINLTYSENGKKLTKDSVIPPDNRKKRPAVSGKNKLATYDPLSALFEARRRVKEAFEEDKFGKSDKYKFTLPIYDGRRRTDINFKLSRKANKDNLYILDVSRKAIEGYTAKELENVKKGEAVITLYLSPMDYLPIKAEGKHPLGTATAEVEKDCLKGFYKCIKDD